MTIKPFTENDIKGAAELAYPVWGEEHGGEERGKEFGMLMSEYIIRYGWYGAPYAFKVVDDDGKMVACILGGDFTKDNGYNRWLDTLLPTFNESQAKEALQLREYFIDTAKKVYCHMAAGRDLYLASFISAVPGCGKMLLNEFSQKAKADGYENLYLWTDSSCDHNYYDHHHFEKVAEFKSGEWEAHDEGYLTYIYRRKL